MRTFVFLLSIFLYTNIAQSTVVNRCKTGNKHLFSVDSTNTEARLPRVYISEQELTQSVLTPTQPSSRVSRPGDKKWVSPDIDIGGIKVRIKMTRGITLPPPAHEGATSNLPTFYPLSIVGNIVENPGTDGIQFRTTHIEENQTVRVDITKVRAVRTRNLLLDRYEYLPVSEEVKSVYFGYLKPGENTSVFGVNQTEIAKNKAAVDRILGKIPSVSASKFNEKFGGRLHADVQDGRVRICDSEGCQNTCSQCVSNFEGDVYVFYTSKKSSATGNQESIANNFQCAECAEGYIRYYKNSNDTKHRGWVDTTGDEPLVMSSTTKQMSSILKVESGSSTSSSSQEPAP